MSKIFNNMNIKEFKFKILKGELRLFAYGNLNWDYYINSRNFVYAITKKKGCYSSCLGEVNYFLQYLIRNYNELNKVSQECYAKLKEYLDTNLQYKEIREKILDEISIIDS